MRSRRHILSGSCCAAAWLISATVVGASPLTVVDVIPTAQSTEASPNPEPSLAVNPNNPQQVLIGAFNMDTLPLIQPYYLTNGTGWTIWTQAASLSHVDGSLAWSTTNNIYAGILSPANDVQVWQSGPPPIAFSQTTHQGGNRLDQPRTTTVTIGGHDHVYVGDNNPGNGHNSATVFFSTNAEAGSGAIWRAVPIERADPNFF
jgi:hypothetical protein